MECKIFQKLTRTLRGRLIMWHLVSTGSVSILFASALSGLFWVTLQNQIDHHIHIAVNEAQQIIQRYQGQERDELIKNLVSAQGMTVIVLSPDGAPVLETNSPDVAVVTEHQLQRIISSRRMQESEPIHFTENSIRFAAIPAQIQAGKGVVAVGYSMRVLYATFYKMLVIVAGGIIFVIIPITYTGYMFLKSQLTPLEKIASQAKLVINTSSLSKRIGIASATQELKTIQDALNSMLTRLENIFRVEREFFSDAAHTLKTPLAILKSHIENEKFSQNTKRSMTKTIDMANETIQDLIFLSKLDSNPKKFEQYSLSKLMTDVSELTATVSEEKRIRVTSHIQQDVWGKGDKKLMQRALSNIMLNAIDYNKPGGTITITLEKTNETTIISVNDTGVGIPSRDLPHVYTRFFRGSNVSPSTKGSGLGLAIAKAVVESLGGKISIKSREKIGTTIRIVVS